MVKNFWKTFIIYALLVVFLFGSIYGIWQHYRSSVTAKSAADSYVQPPLPYGAYPWTVRSIDTQVISKHWPDVTREFVREQVVLLKALGVNYIAVATPYDRLDDLRIWIEEIHAAGLNVWFRSHWAEWEGDEGLPATMSPEEYLKRTGQFIRSNPDLFIPGDAFTTAVEAEQVGVGLGKRFLTWDEYRGFLLAQISTANIAFRDIRLEGQIYTNWLSVNGWVVENQFTPELVEKLGLIVVDHFVGQSQTIGDLNDPDEIVKRTIQDLDNYYKRWKVPILLGEWGYQIYQEVPEDVQAEVIEKMFRELKTKDYLVGVNYWTHLGNPPSIIADEYGANLQYKKAADVIQSFYDPLSVFEGEDALLP